MRWHRKLDNALRYALALFLLCLAATRLGGAIPAEAAAQAALEPAAQAALEPAPSADLMAAFEDTWRWAQFTTSSGLPSNSVYDLVETRAGTVWAATPRGIAWFDDFRWNPVGVAEGIPTQLPSAIAAFGADEIVVVSGRRLYRGSRHGFREVEVSLQGSSYAAVNIAAGAPGELFVLLATDREAPLEAAIYDGSSFRWVTPSLRVFGDQDAFKVWSNGAGSLWMSTATGLQRWENGSWQQYIPSTGVGDVAVSMLIETEAGEGLASIAYPQPARGIWEWPTGNLPLRNRDETADLFQSMDISRGGDAILVYRSGDVRIRQDGLWSPIDSVPPQMAGTLFVRFRDNGDLWVGTQAGLYLVRASLQRWTHWQVASPSLRNDILEILPARDGSLWLATGQGVAVHRPDGSVDWVENVNGTELRTITGLAEDRHGGIWISSGATLAGAYRWNGESWQHFGAAEGLKAPLVHKIRKDRQGRLWFLGMAPTTSIALDGTQPGAFVLEDDGSSSWTGDVSFEPWTPDHGLSHGRVYDFADGKDGSKWFATYGGISRWRDGDWTHWTTEDGLQKNRVFTLILDDADRLWFGDQGSGLGYIDDEGTPRYLTTADGLVNDQVQELRLGPGGELWISTRGGLARLHEGEWLGIDVTTGLSTPTLWPILPLEDRVIIGTSGMGLDVLSLAEAADPAPRVTLSEPAVDRRTALLRWTAHAYWGLQTPESVLTRFRLDDGDWSSWSSDREALLTSVSDGEHAFEVQARGLFGSSGASADRKVFATVLPLYRQPVFYAPVGTLLLLVLVLVESRRRHLAALRQREQDHRERLEERFAERTDALRESEERLRLLLETVHVIPWVADATTWHFTYVGPQAVDVLGYPIERWYEPTFWSEHMHPDDSVDALAFCARQSTLTDRYEFEYRMIAADGNVVWLHDLVAVVKEDGLPTMLRGFMIDITARKRAEAERLEAEAETLEHRERLAHLSRVNVLGEMATGIAHEVTQPLTAVSTYTQACRRMIEAGLFDQDQIIEVLGRISDEAVRAGDMIHGLRALVRKRTSELRACNVNGLVREVIPLAEVEARARGVDLHLHLADDIPEIMADEVQIQQVVLNLIRNAIESTPASGPAVEIHSRSNGPETIEVAVVDRGSGVKESDSGQLFQPFFTTKEEGMGMGLSISRSIIEAHGGQIDRRPGNDSGSTFFFHLPAHVRHATEAS